MSTLEAQWPRQPTLCSKFKSRARHVSKKKVNDVWEKTPKVELWPLLVCTHLYTHIHTSRLHTLKHSSYLQHQTDTCKRSTEVHEDTVGFSGAYGRVLWVTCMVPHSTQSLISGVWISVFSSSSQMHWYFHLTVADIVWQEGKSVEWQREKSRCFGHRKYWVWGHTHWEEDILQQTESCHWRVIDIC